MGPLMALPLLLLAGAAFLGGLLLYLFRLELPQKRQLQQPAPRPGIWFCAHRAHRKFPFQHLYFKVTPRDPSWVERYPNIFLNKDSMGTPFFTLGAGPWEGMLKLEFNRGYDLNDPVSFEEASACESIEQENGRIASLLVCAAKYQKRLHFRTLPHFSSEGGNCNSIVAAIAHRSGIPLPAFCKTFMLCIGIGKPVPDSSIS
jgi:hypothetical protein